MMKSGSFVFVSLEKIECCDAALLDSVDYRHAALRKIQRVALFWDLDSINGLV
jgi:hypothetical protein